MQHKVKTLVFLCTALIIVYGVSAAFWDNTYPALNVFMDALRNIDTYYVETPDLGKMQQGAMRGLIEALDPYSTFLTKEQLQALDSRKDKTAGVGVILSKRSGLICVVSTVRSGPAEAAGMRPGDYLTAIDGVNVEEKSILEVDSVLRGDPGSKVKASVFRGADTKPTDLEMVRRNDEVVAVGSRMLDGGVGLLEIPSLASVTIEQARVKLKTLVSAGAQKLILDLRGCADGKPDYGADLANLFLKSGVIYSIRGHGGEKLEEIKADPEKFVTDLPMVVMINGSTAGPAEITAGALKGNGRALVVGEKSFGVGCFQRRIPLKSGALLVLSTSKYYTPDGKMIENDQTLRETGIAPDVESPDQDRLNDLLVDAYFSGQADAVKYKQLQDRLNQEQLDKALEVLNKGLAVSKRAA
jgi:carboxyl-terminal processing protease